MQPMNFWAGASQILTAFATIGIAWYVALISKRQWQTNREKLRLDLYQRRFDIYRRVIDYQSALPHWLLLSDQETAVYEPFQRALAEAKFMFPAESGVYELLSEFNEHADCVCGYIPRNKGVPSASKKDDQSALIDTLANEQRERDENLRWIQNAIDVLDQKIAPYLNFHSL